MYVEEKNDPSLLTMTGYREKWSFTQRGEAGNPRDNNTLKWKRDWLLFERRRAKTKRRIEQQSGRGGSSGYHIVSAGGGRDELYE